MLCVEVLACAYSFIGIRYERMPAVFFTAKLATGELSYEFNRLLINLSAKLAPFPKNRLKSQWLIIFAGSLIYRADNNEQHAIPWLSVAWFLWVSI